MSPTNNHDAQANQQVLPVKTPLSLRELAEVLIKHYGLHEGRYDLFVEFQIASAAIGPDPHVRIPGLTFGVSKIGLSESKKAESAMTVDAALVNPVEKPSTEKPSKKKKSE